jgi:hypothetical protein
MNKIAPVFDTAATLSHNPRSLPAGLQRRPIPTRRYDIAYLSEGQTPEYQHVIAPSLPSFEAAFSAFGRGLLISTTQGPCAIEDLEPGMMVETQEHGAMPVMWIGSMQVIPNMPADRPERASLVRIMADRFGIGRPVVDMILGPGARMLQGKDAGASYMPAQDLIDGDGVFRLTPPAPTRVYHICLPRHATIQAGGLQLESYHPGRYKAEMLGPELLRHFLSLFPHLRSMSEIGPIAHPHRDEAAHLRAELF